MRVIDLARERFTKNLWTDRTAAERPQLVSVRDETGQATTSSTRVLENREGGTMLKQQAVLFRTSHHSGPLEVELTRRNIPFVKFGGLKFLDAAHIKDMLALLRFAENPRDRVAGFRVMQLIPGVGPASAQRVLDCMLGGRRSDRRACRRALAAAGRRSMGSLCRDNHRAARGPRGLAGGTGAARLWYEPHLDRLHEDAVTRRADLIQLEQIASGYPSRERFLTELTLDPPGRDERPGRGAAARRGLSDPLDDPFRQGSGMEVGLRAQCRRWLHSLRPRHRHDR